MNAIFIVLPILTIVSQFASLGLTMTVLILATTGCGALMMNLILLAYVGITKIQKQP